MTGRTTPLRIGFCGLLGSGNLGNDGSLEAVVRFVRKAYPDALLGCLCSGPTEVSREYGIPSTQLQWYGRSERSGPAVVRAGLKIFGKLLDVIRTARWVRRYDVIIIPGMGVLETSLPLNAWGWPYSLLLVCLAGRVFRSKVALLSVGATTISQSSIRRVVRAAAGLAHYRSYRDVLSRDAMRAMGVDTSHDSVYPDLAFALPVGTAPAPESGRRVVGVGVMAFYGANSRHDRQRAQEIHATYVAKMAAFVDWLLDNDRDVVLFVGDEADDAVAARILHGVHHDRPDLDPARIVASTASSLNELMQQMQHVDVVVASRYHNLVCALRVGRPTLSISYAAKNDALLAEMGLSRFCLPIRSFDVQLLIEQFRTLEADADRIEPTILAANERKAAQLDRQFADLESAVFPRSA